MTAITTPFSGGCACGAIRYESTTEPVLMLHCHCRDCQRSSGGPFSSFVIVPSEAFKLSQGSLYSHDSPSDAGGKTHRSFCPDCGSPILAKQAWTPPCVASRAGAVEEPCWSNREVEVWTSGAQTWDQMKPALRSLKRYPWWAPPQHAA